MEDKLKELEKYANNLLNVENKWDERLINLHVEEPYERFVEEEVWKALNSMKTSKATGPSGMKTDLLKLYRDESIC